MYSAIALSAALAARVLPGLFAGYAGLLAITLAAGVALRGTA
jgi:hypothetical protein